MTCQGRNPDLLLLAHGEMPALRRLLTAAHLRRCPQCRNRQAQYAAVSALLAGAVRDPHMPPWRAVSPALTAGAKWLLTLSVALVLTALLLVALVRAKSHAESPNPTASLSGCRPDLPNDRCR